MAGQIAQVQAELQAAQAAAEAAARALEAARAEDREAKHIRQQAIRGKQRAESDKNAAESQLDELTSQQPEDADTANTALQDALKAIFDKDAEIRLLQQKVTAPQQCPLQHASCCRDVLSDGMGAYVQSLVSQHLGTHTARSDSPLQYTAFFGTVVLLECCLAATSHAWHLDKDTR